MKGLFDTLLNKIRPIVSARPRVLAAHFPPDGLLYHYSQYNLLESSTLHIDAGQVAYLIINEQYTPAYREGEYPLDPDNIPQTETADILFLNTVAIANRLWQSAYQPSQRPLDQPLSGTYSVSIHDADAVCRTVIEHQAINLDDELIDQWVSYTIDHTLINEHISADDIENQACLHRNARLCPGARKRRPRCNHRRCQQCHRQRYPAQPAVRRQNLLPRPPRPANRPIERARHPETHRRRPNPRARPALAKRHDRLAARPGIQPLQLELIPHGKNL